MEDITIMTDKVYKDITVVLNCFLALLELRVYTCNSPQNVLI